LNNRAVQFIVRHKLLIVIALAIIVRLGMLIALPGVFNFVATGQVHGSEAYDTYAQNLLTTGVYGREPGVPDAAIPPLYSYALAGIYAVFGRGYLQVGIFHTLLDALSILMLHQIGKRLFRHGEAVGALAGLAYAFYPYLIFQNLTLIDTPLFMTLLHGFVLAAVLLRERKRLDGGTLMIAVLAGVALGLATLTRPVLPLLAVFLAVWFLFRLNLRQTIVRLAPVAIIAALWLTPWIIRNEQVYHAFVPMSLTAGTNLFQGNNAQVVPYMQAGYDPQWIGPPPGAITADPDSPEGDHQRYELALDYLREHPGDIPQLLWTKFLAHWSIDVFPRKNPVEGQLPRLNYQGDAIEGTDTNGGMELIVPPGDAVGVYAEPLFDQIGRAVHRFYFGGLLLLALIGITLSARQWREVSLLWAVQINMTLVYVLFHPSTRYRVPSDPMLFLFSAYAVVWLWLRWRSRHIQAVPSPAS
jgi:4-amino-4-deoxy-L-arabinose transferase-like glycosyltransferase